MSTTPPEDQRICAWFDSQSEEFITDLMEKHGYDLTPRKAWEAFLGSPAAQESQSESVPAPAEAVQQVNTIECAACGSTHTEPCCHPSEFCQAICNDCNTPLNADGSLWKDQTESRFFVPVGAVVLGTFIWDGVSFPYGSVDGGYFLSDEFGWGWWPELLQMLAALSQRLEQGA